MGGQLSSPCCSSESKIFSCWCSANSESAGQGGAEVVLTIDDPNSDLGLNEEAGKELGEDAQAVCLPAACLQIREDPINVPGMVGMSDELGLNFPGSALPDVKPLAPLPPSALPRYCDKDALKAVLDEGDVVLVRGSWLVELYKKRGLLPSRQELPPEAVCSAQHTLKAPIVAISHCWLTPDHPDPHGVQLRVLANLIEAWNRWHQRSPESDPAIFIDWCSLYQEPRSAEQHVAFERGMRNVSLWYAHRETQVWLLTKVPEGVRPYTERGWPTMERAVSQLLTPVDKVLDMGFFERGKDWPQAIQNCRAVLRPPRVPDGFAADLQAKVFTKGMDQSLVEKQYRQTFQDIMGSSESLDFSCLQWGDVEAQCLAEAIPLCDRLEQLDLTENKMGDSGTCRIAYAIACCLRLRELRIGCNKIADKGAVELASVLPCCRRLQKLDLTRNLIADSGAEQLAKAIPHCPQLQELDLSGNEIGEGGAAKLAEAIPYCKRLERLGLFENEISNCGAARLAAALPQCRGLQELHLGRNDIGDSGAQRLAVAMPGCSRLQRLELGGNEIGDSGAQEIAKALPRCGSLQKLDLARNQIGDLGADRLAAAIPHCAGLQELGLGGNEIGEILGGSRIGDGGAEKVAAAIQRCGHLQKLDLSENRIGNGGVAKLAAAMPRCSSLKELDLRGNQISDGGVENLVAAIPQCSRLKKLYLRGNCIGNGGKKQLREAWCMAGKPEQQLGF